MGDSGPVVLQGEWRRQNGSYLPIPFQIGVMAFLAAELKDFHKDTGKPRFHKFYLNFAPKGEWGDLWHLWLPALHKMIQLYFVQESSTQWNTPWAQMCITGTWTVLPSWRLSHFHVTHGKDCMGPGKETVPLAFFGKCTAVKLMVNRFLRFERFCWTGTAPLRRIQCSMEWAQFMSSVWC